MLSYAIGDIHGAFAKLRELIGECRRHADGREMTFIFIGDYIDRGPESPGVIARLMRLHAELPGRVITLKGNHEAVALDIIDGVTEPETWLGQGGAETLKSYGVRRADELPHDHVEWMRALPLCHDDGRRFFAHAGINPDRPLHAQTEHDLIWIREPFLSDTRDHGRLIVHGHTPERSGRPDLRLNRLNLDTAAGYGGPLTAAVFDEEQIDPIAFLQAR
jgi:serine/threonine protein phosphatase 1